MLYDIPVNKTVLNMMNGMIKGKHFIADFIFNPIYILPLI